MKNRLITTQNAITPQGPETRVTMFDLMGRQLDRHIHDGELVLSTAVSVDRFALVGSGEARIYGTDGRLVQTIKDGSSARFVGDGTRACVSIRQGVVATARVTQFPAIRPRTKSVRWVRASRG